MKINVKLLTLSLLSSLLVAILFAGQVDAIGSSQNPQSGSLGLQATIPSAPPSQAATIAIPANNTTLNTETTTVSGVCPTNLLIKAFSNNVFVGSVVCQSNSYSIKIDLFNGQNTIYVQDFDNLGQGGPLSNKININFIAQSPVPEVDLVSLTSAYAELGANPGQTLYWPIIISGGTPPYAISVDWGDGQSPSLQTSSFAGKVMIKHTYNVSGSYDVTVTATDSKGSTAFLQLVGIANGQIAKPQNSTNKPASINNTSYNSQAGDWLYAVIILVVMLPTFWLGSRHGRSVILKKYK